MRLRLAVGLAAFLMTLAPVDESAAEPLVALTSSGALIAFDSATPGTVSPIGTITGLTMGDTVVGIDRRPSTGMTNGVLYGAGVNAGDGSGRIYILSDVDAAATLVSTLTADPADMSNPFVTVQGTAFGVDFDPVTERLRLAGNTGQNLRINVDNGQVVTDGNLAYAAADANMGQTPAVAALAYSNNVGGAMSTTLQAVDVGRTPDVLAGLASPNNGMLSTVANLAFDSVDTATAYDISGLTGTPYFAVTAAMATTSQLWVYGMSGASLVGTIGGGETIRGLAAYPLVPPSPTPTETQTATATQTPTATPSSSATATATETPPGSLGAPCVSGSECQSGFCADQVCCDAACDGPDQACNVPGRVGICGPNAAAPAPAASTTTIWIGLSLLILIAAMRLRTRRRG